MKERDPEVVAYAAVAHHLVPEDNQPQIVDVLAVVLLHVDPVHVHENVPDHHHGGLVIIPSRVQCLQKVVVKSLQNIITHLALEVIRDHLPKPAVQPLPVLVQHHGVSVSVQLLEGETTVVLALNLLDGIFQQIPNVLHIFLVHCHRKSTYSHFAVFFCHSASFHHIVGLIYFLLFFNRSLW